MNNSLKLSLDPDKYKALLNLANVPYSLSGDFTLHGVMASFSYDISMYTLSIVVLHKPFYISMSMIQNGLQEEIAKL